jgi:hypothetical protein
MAPRPAPGAGHGHPLRYWWRLLGDVDDPYHAEPGVLAAVLGGLETGQHPVARPEVDYLLLVGAVGQDVEERGEAGGQALRRAVFALYRFKTHRMVFELGIHEISYAAW